MQYYRQIENERQKCEQRNTKSIQNQIVVYCGLKRDTRFQTETDQTAK